MAGREAKRDLDIWSDVFAGQTSRLVRVAAGQAADLVELDAEHPLLAGTDGDQLLDCLVFAGNRPLVKNVLVGGRQVVRDGRHPLAPAAAAKFAAAMRRLHPSR